LAVAIGAALLAVTAAATTASTTTTTTTDTGAPVSSSISSLTVPSSSVDPSSVSAAPQHSAQPAPHYTIPSSASDASLPPASPVETDSALPDFDVPNELLVRKSHVPAAPIYKPVENGSSSVHVAIERTQYSKAYVMSQRGGVPSSIIDALERQASIFIPGISKSKFSDLPEENLDDDQDHHAVIGGQFPFENVQCTRPNGTTFAIPNVPCQRVEGHPNLCYPFCDRWWHPHCTPRCSCEAEGDTLDFSGALIRNCTKGYFPQPTRLRETSWGMWILPFVMLPAAIVLAWVTPWLHMSLVQFGGMQGIWRSLASLRPGGAKGYVAVSTDVL